MVEQTPQRLGWPRRCNQDDERQIQTRTPWCSAPCFGTDSLTMHQRSARHFLDACYGYQYGRTPTQTDTSELEAPSLAALARVIQAGVCLAASVQRGKGEAGLDAYQGRPWEGWHHHMTLTLLQVRYGLSLLLLEVFYTPGVDSLCRQVQRQLWRNELARFYHHRTRKCLPPRKLRREIQ